jgi:hypothetical protein
MWGLVLIKLNLKFINENNECVCLSFLRFFFFYLFIIFVVFAMNILENYLVNRYSEFSIQDAGRLSCSKISKKFRLKHKLPILWCQMCSETLSGQLLCLKNIKFYLHFCKNLGWMCIWLWKYCFLHLSYKITFWNLRWN